MCQLPLYVFVQDTQLFTRAKHQRVRVRLRPSQHCNNSYDKKVFIQYMLALNKAQVCATVYMRGHENSEMYMQGKNHFVMSQHWHWFLHGPLTHVFYSCSNLVNGN